MTKLKDKILQYYEGESTVEKLKSFSAKAEEIKQALTHSGVLPEEFTRDVFIALRDKSVIMDIARKEILRNRDTIMTSVAGATANYKEIGYAHIESNIALSAVSLSLREITAFSLLNENDISDFTNIDVYTRVVEDFARAIGTKIDVEAINGRGVALPNATQNTITGIVKRLNTTYNTAVAFNAADSVVAGHTFAKTADIYSDLLQAEQLVLDSGAGGLDLAWVMSNKGWRIIQEELATLGVTVNFNDIYGTQQKTLLGYPVYTTANVPVTMGVASDETFAVLGAFGSHAVVGVKDELKTSDSRDFAFDKDQLAVKVASRVDFTLGKADPFAMIASIK